MSTSCDPPRNALIIEERLRRLESNLPLIDDTPYVIAVAANAGPDTGARDEAAATLEALEADWHLWPGGMVSPAGVNPVTQAAVSAGFAQYGFALRNSSRAVQAEDLAGDADGSETMAVYPDQLPALFYKRSLAGGRIAVFVLNTEDTVEPGTTQGDWLIAQIIAAKEPWRIVMMGNPPRTTVNGGGDFDSLNLGWLPYQSVHLIVTGDSLITEHLNVWGLDILNCSLTAAAAPNARGAVISGEVDGDTQAVWPTFTEIPNGGTTWDYAVGKLTFTRSYLTVEIISTDTQEPVHTFIISRDSVAMSAPKNCCPDGGGGAGNATWENAGEEENIAPDFIGQLGVQQDNGTIWIATGEAEGDWELYQGTQTFLSALARAGATPDFVGQLGLQLDSNVLYRGTGLSAGNWTPVLATDTVTFANAAARAAAVPNRVGQYGYQTDTGTRWTANGVLAGNWTLIQETKTWSNDATRATNVPHFTGQLGLQLDNNQLYRSTGTSAGNWVLETPDTPFAIFLETNGNDSTAAVGFRNRPFLTGAAALAAAEIIATGGDNPVIVLGSGDFGTGDYEDMGSGLLTIRGEGTIRINATGQVTVTSDKVALVEFIPNGETVNLTTVKFWTNGVIFGNAAGIYGQLETKDCLCIGKIDVEAGIFTNSVFNDEVSYSGNASTDPNTITARGCTFVAITSGAVEGMVTTLTDCVATSINGRMAPVFMDVTCPSVLTTFAQYADINGFTGNSLTVETASGIGAIDVFIRNCQCGILLAVEINDTLANGLIQHISTSDFTLDITLAAGTPIVVLGVDALGLIATGTGTNIVNLAGCWFSLVEQLDGAGTTYNIISGMTPNGGVTGTGIHVPSITPPPAEYV